MPAITHLRRRQQGTGPELSQSNLSLYLMLHVGTLNHTVPCRTLNRIQSRIYPTAFGSNENVLVSAPTGAGKTNIAMIAVLREVGNNMTGGMIDKVRFC